MHERCMTSLFLISFSITTSLYPFFLFYLESSSSITNYDVLTLLPSAPRFGSSPGSCTSYDVDAENINPATAIGGKMNDLNLDDSNCNEQRDMSLRSEHNQSFHQVREVMKLVLCSSQRPCHFPFS